MLEYVENHADAVSKLEGEDKRLLEKTLQSFKRNGLALEPEQRSRVKEIKLSNQNIQKIYTKFSKKFPN
jgi:saccharolysin